MSKLQSHHDAINSFLGKAIESNLLKTVKGLVEAFKSDIDFSCSDITMALYSVYRGDNPDMMQYLFDHGVELELHQLSQTIEQSSLEMFKVIFEKYQSWFDVRTSRELYVQVQALTSSKFDKVEFLKSKGYHLTRDEYPLNEIANDRFNRNGDVRTFAIKNIEYTRNDFEALDDDLKRLFIETAASSDKEYIIALEESQLDFTLDDPALVKVALTHENSYLLQRIIARGNKVDAELKDCNAIKFIDDIDAFSAAITMDKTLTEAVSEEGKRQDCTYRLTSIFELEDRRFLDVALEHSPVLQGLREGTLPSKTHDTLVQYALEHIQHAPMLDAFFEILPDNTFSGSDLLERICYLAIDRTKADSSVPFLLKAEKKGAILCKNFFYSYIDNIARNRHGHYKDSKSFPKIAAFLMFGKERFGGAIYERIHTSSDFYNKSEKQMLSSFRTAFYSDNDNTKATLLALMLVACDNDKRVEFINAMTYNDDLTKDIAFKEALTLWDVTPLDIVNWDISKKMKSSVASAICNL